jgi:hypothetical protein
VQVGREFFSFFFLIAERGIQQQLLLFFLECQQGSAERPDPSLVKE